MNKISFDLSQEEAKALLKQYGSIRKAAAMIGIPKSTFMID